MKLRTYLLFLLCLVFLVTIFLNCTEKYPPSPAGKEAIAAESGCVTCHLDAELLKKVATPIEHEPESGEG